MSLKILICINLLFVYHTYIFISFKEFGNLLKLMEDDWKISEITKRKKMQKNLRYFKIIQKFSLVGVVTMINLYSIKQLLTVTVDSPQSNATFNASKIRQQYIKSQFFFNAEKSPNFEVTWIIQYFNTLWSAIAFINYDGFFYITVLHLCAQLSILKMDLRNLISLTKIQGFDVTIKPIVQRHLELKG